MGAFTKQNFEDTTLCTRTTKLNLNSFKTESESFYIGISFFWSRKLRKNKKQKFLQGDPSRPYPTDAEMRLGWLGEQAKQLAAAAHAAMHAAAAQQQQHMIRPGIHEIFYAITTAFPLITLP